jgi:hypothetical protein
VAELGLTPLPIDAGVDLVRDCVSIVGVAGANARSISFGVAAAEAHAGGEIDGFGAHAMGAEITVRRGVGKRPGESVHAPKGLRAPPASTAYRAAVVKRSLQIIDGRTE